MKLTLLHKGLLLVSIPLCFEVTIFAVLINLQDQVEHEAQRISHNNKINGAVNIIIRDGILISDSMKLGSYQSMKPDKLESNQTLNALSSSLGKTTLAESIADIQRRFTELKELAADDPAVLSDVETCEKGMHLALQDIKELKRKLRSGGYADLTATLSDVRKQLDSHLYITLRGGLLGLAEKSYRSIDDAPSKRIRDQIKIYLKAALVLSALLAVMGTTLLSKHLVARLSRLSDNANRLARGKALLSPVGGSDEVAELDKKFHDAACLIEEAKRIRQEVTAMITHDLKTPLQAIRSFLEMLEHGMFGQLNQQGVSLLSITQNSSEHMCGLIDSVLQLEKLRTGNIQLQAVPLELSALLDKCLDSVKLLAEQKGTVLSGSYKESDSMKVDGDAFWLEQVFVNVLSNAIKFSPDLAAVSISTRKAEAGMEVRIKDQGPGIPPKDIKLIFDRFHRVSSTASVAGTGLGLPIAKELIELHHGSISVESIVGEGSTFVICLPLSKTMEAGKENQSSPGSDRAGAGVGERLMEVRDVRSIQLEGKTAASNSGRMTLLHKGLLLVSIPLCFELTIFGVLLNLQDQVEQEAQRISGLKKFNEAANLILRDLVAVTAGLRESPSWQEFMLGDRLDKYLVEIQRSFREMKKLAGANQRTIRNVDMGEKGFNLAWTELAASRRKIQNGAYGIIDRNESTKKMETELGRSMSATLGQLGASGRRAIDEKPSKRIRERIRILLKWALGLSAFFAGCGAMMYSKHLVGRLSRLSENANRLGKGEPLLATVGGTDEIAELDSNFHIAAELIEEAKRMRQEVTAMITHDLKTPLQAIRSFLELLELGTMVELSAQGNRLLANAQRACDHMVDLINSVLQLEKLRTGNLQLQAEPFDLAELLDSSLESVRLLADEKNTVLARDYSQSAPMQVNGDEFWLEQVFVNILSNAIKYSPRNSTVTISTRIAGANVEICIADQGPGIPEEDVKLIFERFHRVKSTSSIAGTGLGLPIARELIQLHHGSISVESKVTEGSTFVISLPLSKDVATD